jgi:hypothetical protein
MAKSRQQRRTGRKTGEVEALAPQTRGGAAPGPELEELDAFIEKVLEEAGEEFLDEFRQIEGE